jgi:radical SAM superfamily enzyme YgiQ (UPF0313 family)
MKTLLAYISSSSSRSGDNDHSDLLPIGLCSLYAILREKGYRAILANLSGMPDNRIKGLLSDEQPDIVALSMWTHNRHETAALVKTVRTLLPAAIICLGGGHASHCADEVLAELPEANLVIFGEGELTLLELVDLAEKGADWSGIAGIVTRVDGTSRWNAKRERIADLDSLPFPSGWLDEAVGVDLVRQPEFISSSRGCPAACRFCSSPNFWGRQVRYRSPVSVVDEICSIRDRFGLIYISIRDDTFTADKRRTIAFCQELINRRVNILWNCQSRVEVVDEETLIWMKRAGCECIQLGVESGSEKILELLGKKITPDQVKRAAELVHRIGLNLSVYLITAIPGETDEDRQATIALLKAIKPQDAQVSPLAYYPGTALYNEAVATGHTGAEIFKGKGSAALLADPAAIGNVRGLVRSATGIAPKETESRFAAQKKLVGHAAATCVMAGDYYARIGDLKRAESEYSEIVRHDVSHPWGWYLLGELAEQNGQRSRARDCYGKVLELVPKHHPSQEGIKRMK